MKKWWFRMGLVVVLVGAGAAGYRPTMQYWKLRNQPQWRTANVSRGDVIAVVNSTGTIKPVLSVQVGSFVSGPIEEVVGNFNQEVQAGDTLARIDPRIYEAERKRATAALANARAEVRRIEALLKQASNDESRALTLRAEDARFISDTEMDQYRFNKQSLEAQREVALASVAQAESIEKLIPARRLRPSFKLPSCLLLRRRCGKRCMSMRPWMRPILD
jgi:HlyD family secretion protein